MNSSYAYIADLAKEVDTPVDGILSRTLYTDEQVKVVLFGFGAGQELSEHTASTPAILHIVQGEAHLTLGEDSVEARAGAWVRMPPHLQHSVHAKTPVVMLLLLMKQAAQGAGNDASEGARQ
jgi:quercetin dioxygenase-like cupin family protein